MEKLNPTPEKFSELEILVKELKRNGFKPELFNLLEKHPLNKEVINYLVENESKIEFEKFETGEGILKYAEIRKYKDHQESIIRQFFIIIKEGLSGLKRDRVLFHELVHAYCYLASRYIPYGEEQYWAFEALVEFNTKKLRSDHQLLRHAIKSFSLIPEVYDLASYRAFPEHANKPPSFYEEIGVLMDY